MGLNSPRVPLAAQRTAALGRARPANLRRVPARRTGKFAAWAAAVLLLLSCAPLGADTVYQEQANRHRRVILQDCIVITNDSSFITCKHFDLKRRRVVVERFEQESSPYTVSISSAAGRQAIIGTWKDFGFTATVTNNAGKQTVVYDSYLDFFPVANTFFTETVPAQTSFPIKLDHGGADLIEFSKILKIELQGSKVEVFLRDGKTETGLFLMPTDQPATARFMGLTNHYPPASRKVFDFSVPLSQIKEIDFH